MLGKNKIIIGARGSKLSLAQTALVVQALKEKHPELVIEVKIITTKGDVNHSPIPLDAVGKTWFTAEIEQALMNGEIDLAVHSLKDMALESPAGLKTVIVLPRGDCRDALVSKSKKGLLDLPQGSVIGTDSVRRKVLLLDERKDLVVKSIRGNVDTRLKKLYEEEYDAVVLAAAGLERLQMLDVATEIFDPAIFLPAPGQGILTAQARSDQDEIIKMLQDIEHSPTRIAAEAELGFSRAIGGGCKTPVGCHAEVKGDSIYISAIVGNLSDNSVKRESISGPLSDVFELAKELAKKFL